jgi:NADPH:quinone reductase-like Zn-dependent oxidoreductase
MMLAQRPEPEPAINDVVVEVHASGFVPTELAWPSTWTDRAGRDALDDAGGVDLVFDVIGGDIQRRSAGLVRAGGTLVSVVGPAEARPAGGPVR